VLKDVFYALVNCQQRVYKMQISMCGRLRKVDLMVTTFPGCRLTLKLGLLCGPAEPRATTFDACNEKHLHPAGTFPMPEHIFGAGASY
jgi:hypothetical protein